MNRLLDIREGGMKLFAELSAGCGAVLGQSFQQSFGNALGKFQEGVVRDQSESLFSGIDYDFAVTTRAQMNFDLAPELGGNLFIDIRGDFAQKFFTANHTLALPG